MGTGRDLAGRRRPRRAAAQRQGARVRLGRRQRHRDLSRAGPHARDRVGSGRRARRRRSTSTPASTCSAAGWRISSTAGCSSPAGTRTQQLNGIVQTHLFDPGDEHVEPRAEHGGRPLVSDGHTAEQRRDADHLRPREHARGADAAPATCVRSAPRRSSLPLYPWMDVAPNGRAFYSGPDQTLRTLDTTGTGAWQTFGQRDTINRDYGGHAIFDIGKMLVAGGGPSTADARVVDFNGATPQVSPTAPMAFGRRQHNLTVLADGTVLATGGNSSGAGLVDLNAGVYPPSSGTPPRANGARWPQCRSRASTTRPRCCCPTGASFPPAAGSAAPATMSAISPRTPRSSRRPTSSRPTARSRRVRRSTPRRRPRPTARRWRSQPETRRRSEGCARPARRSHSLEQHGAALHPAVLHRRHDEHHGDSAGQRQHRAARALHALHHRCERRTFRCPHGQRPGQLAAGRHADAADGRRDLHRRPPP